MIPAEMDRWAGALHIIRPDWPMTSLKTFATKNLIPTPYRDALITAVWVAADPTTRSPARMLEDGPWQRAITPIDAKPRPQPYRPDRPDNPADRLAGIARVRDALHNRPHTDRYQPEGETHA